MTFHWAILASNHWEFFAKEFWNQKNPDPVPRTWRLYLATCNKLNDRRALLVVLLLASAQRRRGRQNSVSLKGPLSYLVTWLLSLWLLAFANVPLAAFYFLFFSLAISISSLASFSFSFRRSCSSMQICPARFISVSGYSSWRCRNKTLRCHFAIEVSDMPKNCSSLIRTNFFRK